ncbi:MAG: NUDIX domain-containing protein, partial [Bacteroidales bacterium]|nr:NUDIX domain-containing protein [Bacteroidales bacterium]
REVKEELNLNVTDLRFYGTFPNEYQYKGLTYFTIDIVFECSVESFLPLNANDDVAAFRFINPKSVDIHDIGLQSIKKLITKYRG